MTSMNRKINALFRLSLSTLLCLSACNHKLNVQPQGSLYPSQYPESFRVSTGCSSGPMPSSTERTYPLPAMPMAAPGLIGSMAASAPMTHTKDRFHQTNPTFRLLSPGRSPRGGTTTYLNEKWTILYLGIQRANDVLRVMRQAKSISPTDTSELFR